MCNKRVYNIDQRVARFMTAGAEWQTPTDCKKDLAEMSPVARILVQG